MRWPRLSVTALMVVLLILAADLARLRWFSIEGRRSSFGGTLALRRHRARAASPEPVS